MSKINNKGTSKGDIIKLVVNDQKQRRPKPEEVAQYIVQSLPVFFDSQQLYYYDSGVYIAGGEWKVRRLAKKILGDDASKGIIDNTTYLVELETLVDNVGKINVEDGFINVKNGLLNRQTLELIPHTHKRISTIQIPVEYDPTAHDSIVIDFIKNVAPDNTFETVIELIGYCLLPHVRFEKAFMLTGSGGNGKSTFINMLTEFLGHKNICNIDLQSLEQHRFKVAELNGKLLNTFADIPSKGLDKSSIFKSVVSGDRITAERKNKNPFEFKPFAKLIFSANEIPSSSDVTDGYFRRWIIIPFLSKFTPGQADVNLIDKLTTPAAKSTLLNLALQGIRRLEQNGKFTVSQVCQDALSQYMKDTDNVVMFVDELCKIDKNGSCKTTKLYQVYREWCSESGIHPLGKAKVNKRISTKFNLNKFRKKGDSCERWSGIRLSDEFAD